MLTDQTGILRDWAAESWQPECSDVLPLFDLEPETAPEASTTAETGRKVTWQHYHRSGESGLRTGTVWAEAPVQRGASDAWWVIPDAPRQADPDRVVYVMRVRGALLATDSGPDATAAGR